MQIRKEIKIGIGAGQIIFGMTRNDVLQILGNPDSKKDSKYLDEIRKTFKYKKEGIEVSFDSVDDYKLTSIDIEDSKYHFGDDGSVINLSLNEILRVFEKRGFSTPTIDCISNEYEPNHLMLYYNKESLTVSLINYVCDSFSIDPLWKNDDEILWPSN